MRIRSLRPLLCVRLSPAVHDLGLSATVKPVAYWLVYWEKIVISKNCMYICLNLVSCLTIMVDQAHITSSYWCYTDGQWLQPSQWKKMSSWRWAIEESLPVPQAHRTASQVLRRVSKWADQTSSHSTIKPLNIKPFYNYVYMYTCTLFSLWL